jgi:hypothetical protein
MNTLFSAPKPRIKTGSRHGRHTIVWIVGAMIVAILAFIGLKSFIWIPDPAAGATQTIMDRNSGTAEASDPKDAKATRQNNIYCTAHANDPDPFPSWYCSEFRDWAQKIESRDAPSNTLLKVAIVFLFLLNVFTLTRVAKKKDKEPSSP